MVQEQSLLGRLTMGLLGGAVALPSGLPAALYELGNWAGAAEGPDRRGCPSRHAALVQAARAECAHGRASQHQLSGLSFGTSLANMDTCCSLTMCSENGVSLNHCKSLKAVELWAISCDSSVSPAWREIPGGFQGMRLHCTEKPSTHSRWQRRLRSSMCFRGLAQALCKLAGMYSRHEEEHSAAMCQQHLMR